VIALSLCGFISKIVGARFAVNKLNEDPASEKLSISAPEVICPGTFKVSYCLRISDAFISSCMPELY
jgi:hypothetical protein